MGVLVEIQMADDGMDELLTKWEENYKKGLLSFWILLLLYERSSYPYEMSAEVAKISQYTISVDDNSIYRALNRFESVGIVSSILQESGSGPPRRYFSLTSKGTSLLKKFIQRNVLVFESPAVAKRLQAVIQGKEESA
jgi:DNA-binding PadR family transcriptional regulator